MADTPSRISAPPRDDILFSSTPDDFDEPTHVNVRPASWWIERFAERGFAARRRVRRRLHRPARRCGSAAARRPTRPWTTLLGRPLPAPSRNRRSPSRDDGAGAGSSRCCRSGRLVCRATSPPSNGERRRSATIYRRCAPRQPPPRDEDLARARRSRRRRHARSPTWRKERDLASFRRNAEDKDKLIAGLNYHLLAVQRTIGWKLLERLRRLRDRLFPWTAGGGTLVLDAPAPHRGAARRGPAGVLLSRRATRCG